MAFGGRQRGKNSGHSIAVQYSIVQSLSYLILTPDQVKMKKETESVRTVTPLLNLEVVSVYM